MLHAPSTQDHYVPEPGSLGSPWCAVGVREKRGGGREIRVSSSTAEKSLILRYRAETVGQSGFLVRSAPRPRGQGRGSCPDSVCQVGKGLPWPFCILREMDVFRETRRRRKQKKRTDEGVGISVEEEGTADLGPAVSPPRASGDGGGVGGTTGSLALPYSVSPLPGLGRGGRMWSVRPSTRATIPASLTTLPPPESTPTARSKPGPHVLRAEPRGGPTSADPGLGWRSRPRSP